MRKIYNYIFYFTFNLIRFEKVREAKAYAVSFILSMAITFNIASIIYQIKVYNDISHNFKFWFLLIFIVFSLIHLIRYNLNKKYEIVLSEIESKKSIKKWISRTFKTLLITYFIITFLFLAYSVLIDAIIGDFRIVFDYLRQKFFIQR